jgi:hypothetical protein
LTQEGNKEVFRKRIINSESHSNWEQINLEIFFNPPPVVKKWNLLLITESLE